MQVRSPLDGRVLARLSMALANLTSWFHEVLRQRRDRQPRELRKPLPAIEQFERRFCLGMVASAGSAAWSSPASAPAADELVFWDRPANIDVPGACCSRAEDALAGA